MFDKLSHYTNFTTLDCIISNKSLRFSRLDCLNDIYEKQISYLEYFDKAELYSTFIACFSFDEENIPLWCLYARSRESNVSLSTAIKDGVQLKFDRLKMSKILDSSDLKIFNEHGRCIFTNLTNGNEENHLHISRTFLENVEYSDIKSCKEKYAISCGKSIILDNKYVGKIKPEAWSFEKEVRAILKIRIDEIQLEPIDHGMYYYLDLGYDAFESIEIVVNPFLTQYEYEKKKNELLSRYEFLKPNQIIQSKLTSTISF